MSAKQRRFNNRKRQFEMAFEPEVGKKGKQKHKEREATQRVSARPLVCKTAAQEAYLKAIRGSTITFGLGPAGTGKTFVMTKHAAQELDAGNYKTIVILRPIVEVGETLGFLPGDLAEKTDPYAEPFLDALREHYGPAPLQAKMGGAHPTIQFVAPQLARGRTFKDSIILIDEAQNLTPEQTKTLLTRIGENSKLVISGDPDQTDIDGPCGLTDAVKRLKSLSEVSVITFTEDDIVRHGIIRDILMRYRKDAALAEAA